MSDSSPVLIVKNEKQDRPLEINERQLREEFANLEKVLSTNLATNRGLKEIKQAIQQYIVTLPHVGTQLPQKWMQVRQALEADPRDYITQDQYLKICQDHDLTERDNNLLLSSFLHDLGVCLHFQEDDLLSKTVILKPTWGTVAVYKLLNNAQVIHNQGKFTREDLAQIWNEDKYKDMCPELLRLMMKFRLCYEIPGSPNTYIAPQFLSVYQPEYEWDPSHNLQLRYTYDFMPKGILTRFIVEMHYCIEEQGCVWRTGVVLNKDGARAEVVELYHRKEIRIRVSGQRKRDLLAIIRHELDKIHHSYQQLKPVTLVPCNCATCKNLTDPHFYKLQELQERQQRGKETIECSKPPYYDVNISSLIDDIYVSFPVDDIHDQKEGKRALGSSDHQPRIYRIALPLRASSEEKQQFQSRVEQIRRANPDWKIESDKPLPGEEKALILIHDDDNAPAIEASYILSRSLTELTRRFWL